MSRSRKNRKAVDQKPVQAAAQTQQAPRNVLTLDAFSNMLARMGYGTPNLMEATDYPLTRLTKNYQLMNSLYRSHWVIRRIIDVIPEDMVKNWYQVSSQVRPDLLERIDKLERKTRVKARILEALKWGRLYGGAAAIIMIDGHESILDQPLDYDTIMPGSFKGLMVVDRWSGIYPGPNLVTDINDPEFGLPDTYQVRNDATQETIYVHHSRVLRFIGRDLPNWERQAEVYWGASEVEHVFDELKKRDNTSWNIANLVFRANVMTLAMEDMDQVLSVGNQNMQEDLYRTVQAQNWLMNNFSMLMMGPNDKLEQKQYTFSGLSDVYESFMLDLAGAAEIPVTKLFGRAPAGLNATGESDMQNYYDTIEEKQEAYLAPVIDKLLPVLFLSELGAIPDDMDYRFKPIRRPSDTEKSDLGQKMSQPVFDAFDKGVISQKTALKELRQQEDLTGLWSNITDEDIETADTTTRQMGDFPPMEGGTDLLGLTGDKSEPNKRLTNDAKAESDKFAIQAIADLNKSLGFTSENPPSLVAHAEKDGVWAQVWDTGMDWNCYWYMLYSEHEGPRLIAYVEDFDEADLIVTEGAPKLLKAFAGRARRPSRFWQDIVNEWVAAHSKG